MLTLSGIIATGVLFVMVASLVVYACIRGQRLRQQHSLAPKKLEHSMDHSNGAIGRATSCNGSVMGVGSETATAAADDLKINTLNSLEKNLIMKNTIMKIAGANGQVMTTVANGGGDTAPAYLGTNGNLPVYSDYDYNYSYPNGADLVIANGNVIHNGNHHQQQHHQMSSYGGYDNLTAYPGHYLADYSPMSVTTVDKVGTERGQNRPELTTFPLSTE